MKETLEKLWTDYFSDECAVVDTNEERVMLKQTAELHQKANDVLNAEQQEAVENYVDALCDMEALLVKKAVNC